MQEKEVIFEKQSDRRVLKATAEFKVVESGGGGKRMSCTKRKYYINFAA